MSATTKPAGLMDALLAVQAERDWQAESWLVPAIWRERPTVVVRRETWR